MDGLNCYVWVFKNKPHQINYFYEKSIMDCKRRIERTYRITANDYEILEEIKEEDNNDI